jgi:hypothetical protein
MMIQHRSSTILAHSSPVQGLAVASFQPTAASFRLTTASFQLTAGSVQGAAKQAANAIAVDAGAAADCDAGLVPPWAAPDSWIRN